MALELLLQRGFGLADMAEVVQDVGRDADGTGMHVEGLVDVLPDPPHGIGDEFAAPGGVELARRGEQAEVAFVDEVCKRKTLVLVGLGHADDEAQVAFDQIFQRAGVAPLDASGEGTLLVLGEERAPLHLPVVAGQRCILAGGEIPICCARCAAMHGPDPPGVRVDLRGPFLDGGRGPTALPGGDPGSIVHI